MSITIFSLVLSIAVLYIFLKREKIIERLLFILLFVNINNINIGYFVSINGFVVSYSDFMTAIFAFVVLYRLIKQPYLDRRLFKSAMFIIGVCLIGIFGINLWPSNAKVINYLESWDSYFRGNISMLSTPVMSVQTILQFVRMILFLFIIIFLKKDIDENDWNWQISSLIKSSRVMLIPFAVELVTHSFLKIDIYYKFRKLIFLDSKIISNLPDRILGLSVEPSYYANTIFLAIALNIMCLNIVDYNVKNRKKILITICGYIILGIFSGAFTFVWMVLVLIIFIMVIEGKRTKELMFFSIFSVALIVGFIIFVSTRIDMLMNSDIIWLQRIASSCEAVRAYLEGKTVVYSSEGTRLISILMLLQAWITRPLFGIGMGTTFCYSGVISILATVGIIGFLSWYKFIFCYFPRVKVDKIYSLIFLLAFIPTGDFELFYGFNIVIWVQMSSILSKRDYGGRSKWINYQW